MSKDLQEQIRLSREAFEIATHVSGQLKERFQIDELNVAANMQKVLVVTGHVKSEEEKIAIADFLQLEMPEWECVIDLDIL